MVRTRALMESLSTNLGEFLHSIDSDSTRPQKKFLRDGLVGLLRGGGPSSWTCPIWPNRRPRRWITSPPSATAAPGNLPTGRQAGQRVLAGGIIHLRVTQESRTDSARTVQPRTAALSRTGPRHHRGRPVCLSADNHVSESVRSNELRTIKP